jgi:hypothetical protein
MYKVGIGFLREHSFANFLIIVTLDFTMCNINNLLTSRENDPLAKGQPYVPFFDKLL